MPDESTASDLVERTRAIFEAMDRDWDIDALEADWAPDIVWDLSDPVSRDSVNSCLSTGARAARWGLERVARGRYQLPPLSRATSSSIASSAASSGLVSRLT